MLKTLSIENIAVIEKADVDFADGLNVLTGETGAGKSIIVDSINAVLGERTSKELVRHSAEYGNVAALFENVSSQACKHINELGFETDDNSILITRRISASGKTSCKINGIPSTVALLKEVGNTLVNIHGQHDSQALLNPDKHFEFIDIISDDKSVLADYKIAFSDFMSIRRKLKSMTMDEETKQRRLEVLNYQIDELEKADIKIGEKDALTKRRQLISNAQTLRSALNDTLYAINGDEEFAGILALINNSGAKLSQLNSETELTERLDALSDEIENVKELALSRLDLLEIEPGEIENIEERLDLLYKLSLKYGNTEEAMLAFLEDAVEKRKTIMFADEMMAELNEKYDSMLEAAVEFADRLSAHRKETAKEFEKKVADELAYLDMPSIKFTVDFEKGKLSSSGYDKIEFLISTNPGEPPKPLAKIASGGELSRIMLAIKNIIAGNDIIGTLIFDEIDSGVSGRASRKIGLKLKSVAESTQVICVTHSAQIAAVADEHFLISKEVSNNRTYTKVIPLDFDARKHELARIMGGIEITDTMLLSAEELLTSQ